MSINVRRLQRLLGVSVHGDQMAKGVEEGWITPPQKVGRLGAPLRLKVKRRSIDVLNEDGGE